jgi:DNA modification methylase
MQKLSDEQIDRITELLKEGKSLPEDYKASLFETKKEYELVYEGKEREQDILADTMAVPLQKVKIFQGDGNVSDWTNMLIFGDNLQVLKTLLQMKQEGRLKNGDGTPGVRLVYIDPPFASRQEFRGSRDQKAYQDRVAGAEFLEFLRKRMVLLRELLSENGSVYVHLDQRKGHHFKVLMDEIFGEQNYVNEIVWKYNTGGATENNFSKKHDTILFYAKNADNKVFNPQREAYREDKSNHFDRIDDKGRKYRVRTLGGKDYIYYLDEGRVCHDVWEIDSLNAVASSRTDYPTQKPDALIDRIVKASSNPGDLVLDCFAGSGTTVAVAERLGRRWIAVDCGKLAIYTMQKRLLRIAESKNVDNPKERYGKDCAPFALYNAGLYDYQALKELPWQQYREFALTLFQCRDEKHSIGGFALDGYLGEANVLVFDYRRNEKAMVDRTFIEQLHGLLGKKVRSRFFIVAPAGSVAFLEDYIELGVVKYYILRIPYSIIEEIHHRGFSSLKQPVSEFDVNNTVDAVGFDFVQIPTVECSYTREDIKDPDLLNQGTKECVIGIKRFESKILSKKPVKLENYESLSMVMLDYDFDGEVFDLDDVFYAEDLKKNGYEVRFAADRINKQCMIIYLDIFGNEKREVKKLSDFVALRGK